MRERGSGILLGAAWLALLGAAAAVMARLGVLGEGGTLLGKPATALQGVLAAWLPAAGLLPPLFLLAAVLTLLAAVLVFAAIRVRPRVLHYRVVEGRVTVPMVLVERLAADLVAEQPGLAAARVRLGHRRGMPRMTLHVVADYLSDFRRSVTELKERLSWALTERTGLVVKDVDVFIELTDRGLPARAAPPPAPGGGGAPEAAAADAGAAAADVPAGTAGAGAGTSGSNPEAALPDLAAMAEAALAAGGDTGVPEDGGTGPGMQGGAPDPLAVGGVEKSAAAVAPPDLYYETISAMERAGVARDYIIGWAGGWLGNPPREPQRVTGAYQAGYDDGLARRTDAYLPWVEGAGRETA